MLFTISCLDVLFTKVSSRQQLIFCLLFYNLQWIVKLKSSPVSIHVYVWHTELNLESFAVIALMSRQIFMLLWLVTWLEWVRNELSLSGLIVLTKSSAQHAVLELRKIQNFITWVLWLCLLYVSDLFTQCSVRLFCLSNWYSVILCGIIIKCLVLTVWMHRWSFWSAIFHNL